MIEGLTSAFAFGTVAPLRRAAAPGQATLTAFPVVGVVLGVVVAGALWAGRWAFGPNSLLAGVLAVAAVLLLTRGLHVDGLADTADGLGCYGPPERACAVMREGGTGPFGVAAVVVVLGAQAAALAALPTGVSCLAGAVTAMATGRVAAVLTSCRGVPAAPGSSLGARVAGTQSPATVAAWTAVVAILSAAATPRLWQGPAVVLLALLAAATLVRHCVRRFGGVTGDVMGAAVELATTLVAVGLVIRA
ncbi:MAG: adenosylcobinamide-GDP ribazoletransferase [Mycobacterium sp.]|nr:adenosylcobinamide-GDP ribazoletransferase [Mycobacterium sp.]